jgi:hypothetical protein
MAKKWYRCKGWSIPNICIFLQQGNGLASGGQHNYQQGGPIGHFGVRWWRRKWGAKDNILGRYHDGFRGGIWSHKTGNTKVTNGIQQCEPRTHRIWFCSVCSTKRRTIKLIFNINRTKTHGSIVKISSGLNWLEE